MEGTCDIYIYYTVYHDLLWYANGLLIFRSNMLNVVDGVKVQLRTDWDLITSTARWILCQQKSSHWSFSHWSWIGPFHTSIHYIGNQLFLDLRTFTERWPPPKKHNFPPSRSRWFLPCPLPCPIGWSRQGPARLSEAFTKMQADLRCSLSLRNHWWFMAKPLVVSWGYTMLYPWDDERMN